MTDLGSGDGIDMQMAVAAVLADNQDVRMLLRVLGDNLQDAFGDRVEVERSGGGLLHKQPTEVRAIVVHLDQDEYEARLDGHAVRCSVGRSSGGIRIRNEPVSIEEWLHKLLGALQTEAASNQSARAALESIVIGGTS